MNGHDIPLWEVLIAPNMATLASVASLPGFRVAERVVSCGGQEDEAVNWLRIREKITHLRRGGPPPGPAMIITSSESRIKNNYKKSEEYWKAVSG